MAKTKAARRGSGAHKYADPKTRQTTTRHPSGFQHRKKAKVRRTTHGAVSDVLNLASYGFWRVGRNPRDWLWAGEPGASGFGVYGPTLAVLQNDVLVCLRRIQPWRRMRKTGTLVPENAFNNATKAAVKAADEEVTQRGAPDSTFQQIMNALNICSQVLEHLAKDERWRNVYQCVTCQRWFYARHDPADAAKPYCGKRCWPSTQYVRSERPRTRLQWPKK